MTIDEQINKFITEVMREELCLGASWDDDNSTFIVYCNVVVLDSPTELVGFIGRVQAMAPYHVYFSFTGPAMACSGSK